MVCPNCGCANDENARFCQKCGFNMNSEQHEYYMQQPAQYAPPQYPQPQPVQQMPVQPQPVQQVIVNQSRQVKDYPSAWGWFGRILLSAIPFVGFIILLVWAFGGTQCPSVKTWARAQFIFILIPVIIVLISFFLFGLIHLRSVSR